MIQVVADATLLRYLTEIEEGGERKPLHAEHRLVWPVWMGYKSLTGAID
jgi:hypothetical protein